MHSGREEVLVDCGGGRFVWLRMDGTREKHRCVAFVGLARSCVPQTSTSETELPANQYTHTAVHDNSK